MKKEEKGFDFIDLDETSEWSRLEIEKNIQDMEYTEIVLHFQSVSIFQQDVLE